MSAEKLDRNEIEQKLKKISKEWRLSEDGQSINRTFEFDDFKNAFAFMTAVALQAEDHSHHPDWHNVYNKVDITFSTHDAGGLTELDFEMAEFVDQVAAPFLK
mgnify:CR=1 FL=1